MIFAKMMEIVKDFEWYFNNGYITHRDGNACIKLEDGKFLVTASGVNKVEMGSQDYVIVDDKCNVLESPNGLKPSIETHAHLSAILSNGVEASVHVHSPNTVALFSLFEKYPGFEVALESTLNSKWPELFRYTKIGRTVPFLEPGSVELHEAIAKSFKSGGVDIIVLQKHGVLASGKTLEKAKESVIRLEHVSGILLKILSANGGNIREIL